MLDAALCDRSVSQWLALKSLLSNWLMTPVSLLIPLAVAIALPLIIPRLRWKPHLLRVGVIVLLIYLTATIPLTFTLAAKGLVALLPSDSGGRADAIVILGRGPQFSQSRVDVAAQLWKAQRAPLIFATGIGDAPDMIRRLKAQGIPNQALAYEGCSRTTEENARFTAMELKPQGIKSILLITDSPHMLRSLLTFRSIGFTVIPHTTPIPPELAPKRKTFVVFYEYLALVSYGLQGRFFPQH
ncbi:MAG TPA: YdcF family protein [Coleofasciculaceae cyanobacterium]